MGEISDEAFWDWISSLNPVVIDVDENGEFVDSTQLEQLTDRIKSEINEIKGENSNEQ